jgi:GMP synthase (glutamine-hydrolysing)
MNHDVQKIIVLDFGGQYKELIARKVRALKVMSVIMSGDTPIERIQKENPIGIILTGGPHSVYKEDSLHADKALFDLGVPVLSMHAPYEVVSKLDVYSTYEACLAFFKRK